jgi:Pyridoxamine 5'-phosphate oxidase
MILRSILSRLALLPLVVSAPLDPQSPLESSSNVSISFPIPTRYESTVLGRRLLALSSFGVVSTIFPPQNDDESRWTPFPDSVADLPMALPDYLADCDNPSNGNPTLLFLDPSTPSRNTRHGPHYNVSLSLSWWTAYTRLTGHVPYSPASLPRLSFIGYTEEIPVKQAEQTGIVGCFLKTHPDAKWWLPGDEGAAHGGRWVRLVVQEVYWLGGFGDRAFIGWLDPEEWKGVQERELRGVRLPGEKE